VCGRFANHVSDMHAWASILGDWPKDGLIGYNVAPTSIIPVFNGAGGFAMRWGLVPSWSTHISTKYATFNARIESITKKPAFRSAWHNKQRCLIPVQGYYEWRSENGGKQPYFVSAIDSSPLILAGLFEAQHHDDIPMSCTVITTPANENLVSLHPRMPLMVSAGNADRWLSDTSIDTAELVETNRLATLDVYPVSKRVNNARNQGAALCQRLEDSHDRKEDEP
jgi:putative SOS response-associated peptidase YedK